MPGQVQKTTKDLSVHETPEVEWGVGGRGAGRLARGRGGGWNTEIEREGTQQMNYV